MMNRKIALITIVICTFFLLAAKPVIEVPNLPQSSELELYEDSEGLFTMKILEYYKIAVALETQLRILGVKPSVNPVLPTYEELEDMEVSLFRKYHKIAKQLESEVLEAPESDRQILLERINQLELQLRDTVAIYTIEKGTIRNQMLDLMLTRLKEMEEKNAQNIDYVIAQNYVNCMDYSTLIAVAGVSKLFFSNGNDIIKNDPGIGVQVSLNAGKIAGFGDGFEVRYEYFAPKFFSEYELNNSLVTSFREQWNTNVNTVSFGGKAVLGKNPKLMHGFNIFLGYFWANGSIYNQFSNGMNWDGASLSFDYFLSSPSCKFPVEFFAGLSVYNSFSRNLVFRTSRQNYENIDLGKTHLSANVGFRYNIWRSPF